MAKPVSAGRHAGLDLLRFLAVVLVLGRHLHAPSADYPGWLITWLSAWTRGGWVGVDLFFVLSGYLVSGLLFSEQQRSGHIRVGRFLIRRGFKLYPSFWIVIALTIAKGLVTGHPVLRAPYVVGELTFTQNYVGALWGHTWSLAVEEHFYILLSVFLFLRYRPPAAGQPAWPGLPRVFALVAIGCLAARLLTAGLRDFTVDTHVYPTHLRLDGLLFGVFLSWHKHYTKALEGLLRVPPAWLAVAGCACLAPAFLVKLSYSRAFYALDLTLNYLGSGLLVLSVLRVQTVKTALLRGLVTAGACSYCIYLWHLPVANWLVYFVYYQTGWESWWPYPVVYVTGSVAVGIGMSKLIEWPTLRLRDRLFPSTSKAL